MVYHDPYITRTNQGPFFMNLKSQSLLSEKHKRHHEAPSDRDVCEFHWGSAFGSGQITIKILNLNDQGILGRFPY